MKKLIAVGTKNPNPEAWKCWNEVKLYIADSIEEAKKMSGCHHNEYPAVEVDMSRSRHLLSMPEFPDD